MALYYGKHKVRDFDHWRPYFEGDQQRLNHIGVRLVHLLRGADDPNEVHFIFDVPDLHAFLSLLQQDDSKKLLHEAGVLELPVLYQMQEAVLQKPGATAAVN